MKCLIVGLGNVGSAYTNTRHNAGFMVVDYMASQHQSAFSKVYLGHMAHANYQGATIHWLKPSTLMNLSGKAVHFWLEKLTIPPTQLLVVVDDIHTSLGVVRLRPQGGTGGHNGLKSIRDQLGTIAFPRLRLGVGHDFEPGGQSDYVLGTFTAAEKPALAPAIVLAAEMAAVCCTEGLLPAMNRYNQQPTA